MATSPSPLNLHIGKGIVSFKRDGGSYRDVGNVGDFVYTPTVTKKQHYSSRVGLKKLDAEFVVQLGAQIDLNAYVSLTPSSDLKMIATNDDFTIIEISAEVLVDPITGAYGTWTVRETAESSD